MTRAMEQKLEELKRIIEDRFDKQKVLLKKTTNEICSAIILTNFLTKINSRNHMFQKQIIESKKANVKLKNEINELQQMAGAHA